jgi:hypothetical protein
VSKQRQGSIVPHSVDGGVFSALRKRTCCYFSGLGCRPRRVRSEWACPTCGQSKCSRYSCSEIRLPEFLAPQWISILCPPPPSARALQQAWNEASHKFRAEPSRITCGWKLDAEHVADTIGLHTGALRRWRTERVRLSEHAAASAPNASARVCERVVVFNKRDLVPEWGIVVWTRPPKYWFETADHCNPNHSPSRRPWPQNFPTKGRCSFRGIGRTISEH